MIPGLTHPKAGKPIDRDHIWPLYKAILEKAGLSAALFGLHTPRIIGATTLCLGGATEMDLRAMGRWSSDVMYIYVRKCRSHLINLNAILSSTDIDPWISAPAQEPDEDDGDASEDGERTETDSD